MAGDSAVEGAELVVVLVPLLPGAGTLDEDQNVFVLFLREKILNLFLVLLLLFLVEAQASDVEQVSS